MARPQSSSASCNSTREDTDVSDTDVSDIDVSDTDVSDTDVSDTDICSVLIAYFSDLRHKFGIATTTNSDTTVKPLAASSSVLGRGCVCMWFAVATPARVWLL